MNRTIEIGGMSDELIERLDQSAKQVGVGRAAFVRRLIERAVAPPEEWQTLSEFLDPLHDYTEAHGMREEEIEAFLGEQIADARRQRRGRTDIVGPAS